MPSLFWAILLMAALLRAEERPTTWAQPVLGTKVENLYRVTPQLYRCAQPTAEGMRELEKLGIRTVINLRAEHDDLDELAGTRLRMIQLEIRPWDMEDERVARVLALLREKEHGPFVIHC